MDVVYHEHEAQGKFGDIRDAHMFNVQASSMTPRTVLYVH